MLSQLKRYSNKFVSQAGGTLVSFTHTALHKHIEEEHILCTRNCTGWGRNSCQRNSPFLSCLNTWQHVPWKRDCLRSCILRTKSREKELAVQKGFRESWRVRWNLGISRRFPSGIKLGMRMLYKSWGKPGPCR